MPLELVRKLRKYLILKFNYAHKTMILQKEMFVYGYILNVKIEKKR